MHVSRFDARQTPRIASRRAGGSSCADARRPSGESSPGPEFGFCGCGDAPRPPSQRIVMKNLLYLPIVAAALATPLASVAATPPGPLDEQWLQTSISGD